jgi:hypothetical protein
VKGLAFSAAANDQVYDYRRHNDDYKYFALTEQYCLHVELRSETDRISVLSLSPGRFFVKGLLPLVEVTSGSIAGVRPDCIYR